MRARWLVGFVLVLALGCGSPRFAPVSGKVTLDGKPVANALVTFNPIPKEGSSEAGPGSIGTTNANGEFTLRVRPGQSGALVGKHRVGITAMNPPTGDGDARHLRGGGSLRKPIPSRFNDRSTLTFEVPSGGTDQANFELEFP